ncbi:MAG: MATE family efflux transporter [Saprospiraceae bacterium]
MSKSQELGTENIGKLLVKMAVPASIGILVMSIYFIVDTIFVGRFVGSLGIAAITVVLPLSFLIGSFGMAIGVGGASVISRALGGRDIDKAKLTFGNMITITLILAISLVILGYFVADPILSAFGAKGEIMGPAKSYFRIILLGIPCLAWMMMANNVMRGEGKPRFAMIAMIFPAILNIILDPIFIIFFKMGLEGAAWATTISYFLSAGFGLWFFIFGPSELKISIQAFVLRFAVVKEIAAIGGVTLARQGAVSLLSIVLNNSLFQYGDELAIAVWGIINRTMMFANFPVLGVTQGFIPIAGFNYGAKHWDRVKKVISAAIKSGTFIAIGLFTTILFFSSNITSLFTNDPELIRRTPGALIIVFMATPLITVQLIGAAYFQAIGKALPALFLTLTKQGFFLIPLVLILPIFFNLNGIWYAFPIADVLAAVVTFSYLRREVRRDLMPKILEQKTFSDNFSNPLKTKVISE